tara:strand:+ start:12613 stop:13167 length:555 start_codon:yes stop_codon:yes gene_type:complete
MTEEEQMDKNHIEFLAAFNAMTQDLPKITKGKDGYNYKYAALEDILELWSPVFDEHGFVLRQSTVAGQGGDFPTDIVTSKITHIPTGFYEESSLTLISSSDYQAVGSGCTYLRRYTLLSVCAQQPVGEDWDGLAADPVSKKRVKKKVENKTAPPVTDSKEDASNSVGQAGQMSEDEDAPDDLDL